MEKSLTLNGSKVEIRFPFDWAIIDTVRELPDRDFDETKKLWHVPATAWHTSRAIAALKQHGFIATAEVMALSKQKQVAPAPKRLEIDERLYPFQKDGFRFLVAHKGSAILADGMGLGKTPQSLAFVNQFAGRTLVVAPANTLYKWLGEVAVWTNKTAAVIGTGKLKLPDTDIHIMSYEIMRIRHEELAAQLYDCVVFDECHALKNYKAGRTRAAKKLIRTGAIHKTLFLSGTPFLNHPAELFPVLNIINPVAYPSFFQYAKRYCGAQYDSGYWYFPKGIVTNVDELADRLSSVMLRRTKQEVLKELPDKTRVIVPIEMSMTEYKAAEREFRDWYGENRSASTYNVLVQMTAMRKQVGLGKVGAAAELAKDLLDQDEKIVLYAHHLDVVEALKQELSEYKTGVIVGSVSPKTRQAIIDEFLHGDLRLVIMSSAGAEGIDLYSASHIVFVEREWTPAKEEQAEDRLHRIGQKSAVTCWYLSVRNTIDEKFANIVDGKRRVFGAVVGQDEIVTSILGDF